MFETYVHVILVVTVGSTKIGLKFAPVSFKKNINMQEYTNKSCLMLKTNTYVLNHL
jgi:hypothetical protein